MNPIDLRERFDPNDDVDALLASTDRILSRYAPKPTPPTTASPARITAIRFGQMYLIGTRVPVG